jgi:hypothetical protein
MPTIWETHFGYLVDEGYTIVIGEFGGKYGHGGDPDDVIWQNAIVDYLDDKGIGNFFYWCWNPNSADTGGILQDDWTNIWEDKYRNLRRLMDFKISVDANGNPKDNFSPQEHVYGKTTGFSLSDGAYNLYVVSDQNWTAEDDQIIPPHIDPPGTANDPETTIEVHNGNIQKSDGTPEDIWVSPPASETARYDIIVDINKDGDYDPSVDLLDYENGVGYGFSLPVELSFFTAITTNDGTVILSWRTESEVNNIGFAVYRTIIKDSNYEKISFVFGAGNSAMPTDYQLKDTKIEQGKTYLYYIEDIDIKGDRNKSEIIKVVVPFAQPIPTEIHLLQNYPNPFNPETWIPFKLAQDTPVIINIYNAKGQLIRTITLGTRTAGIYTTKDRAAYWDGRDSLGQKVSSGVYYYTLQAGEFRATRKMVIVK